jgi:hypothetical protein
VNLILFIRALDELNENEFVFSSFTLSINHCSSNCTDGYLKIYLKGQETVDAYDKFDHELCGTEKPLPVVSDGPRLVMVFSSGELQGRGFKVNSFTIFN